MYVIDMTLRVCIGGKSMNFDEFGKMIKDAGINMSLVLVEGKAQEAYKLGYDDPYVPSQASVDNIRHIIQSTMDKRKMELYQDNFEGVPNSEDKLEMKSYEFVESILPQIITTDEKDKIPEKGSTSFDPIHEWVEKECVKTGKDIVEEILLKIYSRGRIEGHLDEVNKLLLRVLWNANKTIRSEKERIYKENYYDKPTEEALVQMKGYNYLEEKLPEIIQKYLEPQGEETITAILNGNAKNRPSGIIENVAKFSNFISKQNNELETEKNSFGTIEQIEKDIDLDRVLPLNARNFPPKLKLVSAYLYGLGEGVEFGYRLAMLALADNNASKELMLSASQYFNARRHKWDENGRKKIDQEYDEKKHLWNE